MIVRGRPQNPAVITPIHPNLKVTFMYPKLYKRDTSGGVRVWWAEQDHNAYVYKSGKLDGKIVTTKPTIALPKNLGKRNELTSIEQAQAEISAMYTKKRKRGYFDDVKKIDTCTIVKPMLAHKYKDHVHKLKYPVYVQPKLDGIRCLATANGLFSRKNERIISCPHIEEAIMPYVKRYGVVFDGELYNHELKDDFNQIQSLVTREHIDTLQEIKIERYVQYHIYDVIMDGDFVERQSFLKDLYRRAIISEPLILVKTKKITEPEYLDDAYETFLEDGYEGQMVRSNVEYQNKRTSALLKRKEFIDGEFKIVSIHEGKGNRSGMAGYAYLDMGKWITLPNGERTRTFKAAFMGDNAHRVRILKNKKDIVGQMATVKYFQWPPNRRPRHPNIKAIRVKGY